MTLTYAFKESFTYERRSEPGTRPPALTLKLGRGSCRDLALLMIEALRCLGLAARFVSGYLYVPSRDGPRYRGGGSTHAWCEVYLPGAGWVEFDPTNAIVGNRDLIRVAVARDPSQAIPLSGSYFGAADDFREMTVEVKVRSETAACDAPATRPPRRNGRPNATRTIPAAGSGEPHEDSRRLRDRLRMSAADAHGADAERASFAHGRPRRPAPHRLRPTHCRRGTIATTSTTFAPASSRPPGASTVGDRFRHRRSRHARRRRAGCRAGARRGAAR